MFFSHPFILSAYFYTIFKVLISSFIYIYTHTYTHTYTYIYIYTHIHTGDLQKWLEITAGICILIDNKPEDKVF